MVQPSDWYSLVSVATSGVAVFLALYVLRRIPNRRAGRMFVTAMVFFLLAAIFAFLTRSSVTAPESLLLDYAHAFYFFHMLAVGYTAAFIGMYFHGFRVMGRRSVRTFLQVSLFVAAVFVSSLVTNVGPWPPYGMTVDSADATLALAVLATAYMSTALAVLIRALIVNKDILVRKQALVMLLGILIHGAGAESYAYLRIGAGEFPVPFLTVTALAMSSFFAFAVLRYKLIAVAPKRETPLALAPKFPIKPAHAYAVAERSASLAFRALAEAARGGAAAFVLTRQNPDRVREDFDLPQTPMLWLTDTIGTNHVTASDPEALEALVRANLAAVPQTVVAFDGFEYVSRSVGPDRAVRFVGRLRDLVTAGGGTLVVSVDPDTAARLPEVFGREFEPLPVPLLEGRTVEDVFVIDGPTGLLLARTSRDSRMGIDADLMAGMLTAIMDFVKTSFQSGGTLRSFELGERTVALERGRRVILAVVFRGHEPTDIRVEMLAFVRRAEDRYGGVLDRWDGDLAAVHGLEAMAGRLFM